MAEPALVLRSCRKQRRLLGGSARPAHRLPNGDIRTLPHRCEHPQVGFSVRTQVLVGLGSLRVNAPRCSVSCSGGLWASGHS